MTIPDPVMFSVVNICCVATIFDGDGTADPPPGATAVSSLADAFSFCEHFLGRVGGQHAATMLANLWSDRFGGTRFSSAFSGIGAPEQSIHSLQQYLRKAVPDVVTRVRQTSAIEWNEFSRAELKLSSLVPEHLFCDQNEFLSSSIRDVVLAKAKAQLWTTRSLWNVLSKPGSVLTNAYCEICNKHCTVEAADVHFAGTPCIDHSTQPGAKRQGVLGSSFVLLFVWCVMRTFVQEAIIVHENVCDFQASFLFALLGSLYVIQSLQVELTAHGFPIRRRRRLTLLVHRRLITAQLTRIQRWSCDFIALFKRVCRISYHQFLLASESELARELHWAQTRPLRGGPPLAKSIKRFANAVDVLGHRFVEALNESELLRLRTYRRKWPSTTFSRSYALHQESSVGGCPSFSAPRTASCQTTKQGIQFIDLLDRWIAPKEFLLLQGFQCYPEAKVNGEHCFTDEHLASRNDRRTVEQSGNSMPVPVMTITVIYSYLFVLSSHLGASATSGGSSPEAVRRSRFRAALRGRKRPHPGD